LFGMPSFASFAQPSVCIGTMASDGFEFTLGMFYSYVVLCLRSFALGPLNFSGCSRAKRASPVLCWVSIPPLSLAGQGRASRF
jgi:hypothetical protein